MDRDNYYQPFFPVFRFFPSAIAFCVRHQHFVGLEELIDGPMQSGILHNNERRETRGASFVLYYLHFESSVVRAYMFDCGREQEQINALTRRACLSEFGKRLVCFKNWGCVSLNEVKNITNAFTINFIRQRIYVGICIRICVDCGIETYFYIY